MDPPIKQKVFDRALSRVEYALKFIYNHLDSLRKICPKFQCNISVPQLVLKQTLYGNVLLLKLRTYFLEKIEFLIRMHIQQVIKLVQTLFVASTCKSTRLDLVVVLFYSKLFV